MEQCIRRSIGDTDPIQWLIREKVLGADRSTPVVLTGKSVYITMADSNTELLIVEPEYTFESVGDRDQYFVGYPDELIDGVVTQVVDPDTLVAVQYRYRDGWHTNVTLVIDNKECGILNAATRSIQYFPTVAEMDRAGMYHVYFEVVTYMYDIESEYVFSDVAERTSYFADPEHSDELIEGRKVAVNGVYFTYESTAWVEGDAVSTSSVKYPRGDSLWIHIMDIFNDY